jgi:hypothetical protein
MKINRLRSLIKEAVAYNLKEIEEAAENAAMEAKLNAYNEAIEKVNKKIETAESLEEMKELVDDAKLNELKKHLKLLEKNKVKLEKLQEKKNKKKVVTDEPVEEAEVEEGAGPGGTNYNMGDDIANINGEEGDVDFSTDEENGLNESFLKMQKLAGVITEAQYNSKKSLIESQLNEITIEYTPEIGEKLKSGGFIVKMGYGGDKTIGSISKDGSQILGYYATDSKSQDYPISKSDPLYGKQIVYALSDNNELAKILK